MLPVQVLGELCAVLVRRAGRPTERARATASSCWRGTALGCGMALSWPRQKADCRYLLTEDMQDGFRWRGVTIANPFASSLPHPLTALLNHFP